jgi:hypothetical protein
MLFVILRAECGLRIRLIRCSIKSYEVVGLRREGGQTYCDVLLADGPRLRLPAHWRDYLAGRSRRACLAACTRATPAALRELLCLLRALVNASEAVDAERRSISQGDDDDASGCDVLTYDVVA